MVRMLYKIKIQRVYLLSLFITYNIILFFNVLTRELRVKCIKEYF